MTLVVNRVPVQDPTAYLRRFREQLILRLPIGVEWNQVYDPLWQILNSWISSRPASLSARIKLGGIYWLRWWSLDRTDKAYWKNFNDDDTCITALIAELRLQLIQNPQAERACARMIIENPRVRVSLNNLRQRLGQAIWRRMSYVDKALYYSARLTPFSLRGSYNWAGSYPSSYVRKSAFEFLFSERNFSVSENAAVLHDVSELLFRDLAVPILYSSFPNIPRDRSRVICRRRMDDRVGGVTLREVDRLGLVFDRGKIDLGTRNENADSTIALRNLVVNIEAGYSYTIARMLAMIEVFLYNHGNIDVDAVRVIHPLSAEVQDYSVVAAAMFAYWNASTEGSYPSSMTPVHSWNEVVRAARAYGATGLGAPADGLYLGDALEVP